MVKDIPLLSVRDVELRVQSVTQNDFGAYAQLLIYKNARADMRILDQLYGNKNWKRSHIEINGNLFCVVSVWDDEKQQWVSKEDVGTESNTEAAKGQASDAFKRACVNWGIGRELYSAPSIRIKLNEKEISHGSNGKPRTFTKFHIKEMEYDNDKGCYTALTVYDDKGEKRYDLNKNSEVIRTEQPSIKQDANEEDYVCSDCGATISNLKVVAYSRQKFGSPLCYACQRKAG